MSFRGGDSKLCEFCEEPLGSVCVTALDGSRLHPDCYDKWRRAVADEVHATFVNGKAVLPRKVDA